MLVSLLLPALAAMPASHQATVTAHFLPTMTSRYLADHCGEWSPAVAVVNNPAFDVRSVVLADGRSVPILDDGASEALPPEQAVQMINDVQDLISEYYCPRMTSTQGPYEPYEGGNIAGSIRFIELVELGDYDWVDTAPASLDYLEVYADIGRYDVVLFDMDMINQIAAEMFFNNVVPIGHGPEVRTETTIIGGKVHTATECEDGYTEITTPNANGEPTVVWTSDGSDGSDSCEDTRNAAQRFWDWLTGDGCVMKPWVWYVDPTPVLAEMIVYSAGLQPLVDQWALGDIDDATFAAQADQALQQLLANTGDQANFIVHVRP